MAATEKDVADFLLAHAGIGHKDIAKEMARLLVSRDGHQDRIKEILLRYDESCALILPLARVMQKYINTPWVTRPDGSKTPLSSLNIDDIGIEPQAHAGRNVLAHSFWAAAQIYEWWRQGSPFIDLDIDVREAMIGAFCHDIAKASHCKRTCVVNKSDKSDKSNKGIKCWYDPYHPQVYQGRGSSYHPIVSGDILLNASSTATTAKSKNKNSFRWNCPADQAKDVNDVDDVNERKDLPDELFASLNVDRRILALMGYMHWELGIVNENQTQAALDQYLDKFQDFSRLCGLQPTIQNLKKCILVSLADIRGSFPPDMCDEERDCERLRQYAKTRYIPLLTDIVKRFGTRVNTDAYYPSNRPWFRYQMDKNAERLRNLLLAHAYYRGFPRY